MIHYRFSVFFTFALVALAGQGSLGFSRSFQHKAIVRISPTYRRRNGKSLIVLSYQNSTETSADPVQVSETSHRFLREAAKKTDIDEECILTIHGNQYNMTAWANAHPGTSNVRSLFVLIFVT
jgi:hypothetical protein